MTEDELELLRLAITKHGKDIDHLCESIKTTHNARTILELSIQLKNSTHMLVEKIEVYRYEKNKIDKAKQTAKQSAQEELILKYTVLEARYAELQLQHNKLIENLLRIDQSQLFAFAYAQYLDGAT